MRLIIVLFVGLTILGCGGGSTAEPAKTGEAMAIATAERWLQYQRIDKSTAKFVAKPNGADWLVEVETTPAMPGGHMVLHIDSKGQLTDATPATSTP